MLHLNAVNGNRSAGLYGTDFEAGEARTVWGSSPAKSGLNPNERILSMTRKDYVAVAEAIKKCVDRSPNEGGSSQQYDMAEEIAHVLSLDNPNFDRVRFMSSCGFKI